MHKKLVILLSTFILVDITFSQVSPEKAYLPSQQELAFPEEVVQKCFGINRLTASITEIEQGYGHVNFNKSYINQTICIGDKKYDRGIGVHATSSLLIRLPGQANRFCAEIGLDNNKQTYGRALYKVIFSIEAGGNVLWESIPLGVNDQPLVVDVPLKGIKEFYLKVRSAGERVNLCHADWANAAVVYGKDKKAFLDEYVNKTSILNDLPLSFMLDGKLSRDFLNTWNYSFTDSIAKDRIVHHIKWFKPDGSFEVRCQLIEFQNHSVIEWKLFFKNTGFKNSPLLEQILPLDAKVTESLRLFPNQTPYSPVFLHCNKGSNNSIYDFMPITQIIDLEQHFEMKSHNGRSSESYLPFWNLEYHGSGLVTALGWSGDWKAEFDYPQTNQALMKAGMSNLKLYLKPGEEISSPSVCLLYWEGKESLRGNNLFRRYMRDAVVPKWDGKEPFTFAMSGGASTLETVSERNQIDYIKKIAKTGAEVYWLDAGWYAGPEGASWTDGRGNWYPDTKKFPDGMKILADEAHKNGLKFLLWFDPEVVSPGTEISEKHPEWIIRRNNKEPGLYNLGIPGALEYMTDLISNNLINWDVDIFRNDYNIDPGPFWKMVDEPDRVGITEIRYVEGFYRFWDELLKRKPDLLIDNCASGGRRIDYETCKRSVPLWRSDYECEVFPDVYEASQNQTYGLGYYLPFNSTGQGITYDKYKDRSLSTSSVVLSIGNLKPDALTDVPIEKVKQVWNDLKSYNYLMVNDFYPLTDFSLKDDVWTALQYDNPEKGEGCVLFFRRANAIYSEAEFTLRSIDSLATYRLEYLDSGAEEIVKGNQLQHLKMRLDKSTSAVVKYIKQ